MGGGALQADTGGVDIREIRGGEGGNLRPVGGHLPLDGGVAGIEGGLGEGDQAGQLHPDDHVAALSLRSSGRERRRYSVHGYPGDGVGENKGPSHEKRL